MNAADDRHVRERAAYRCEYCRLPQHVAPAAKFQIEHIRARQHGGKTEPENLALACPRCNAYKGPNLTAVDPETDAVVPLFHPRTQSWHEHFALVGIEILGTSPVGRATASLLCVNDPERLEMREIMKERGELIA